MLKRRDAGPLMDRARNACPAVDPVGDALGSSLLDARFLSFTERRFAFVTPPSALITSLSYCEPD